MVCVDGAARPVAAHVWHLLALDLLPVAHLADRVFPAHKDRDFDSVLDVVVECDFADRVARIRTEPWRAAGD